MSRTSGLVALVFACAQASADDSGPLRVLGISHVSLRVSSVSDARRFYEDFLGLAEVPCLGTGAAGGVCVRVNDRQSVELRPGLVASEDRLDHVAFQVEDLAAARRALAAGGVSASDACASSHGRTLTVVDPEGHTIEFVAHPSGGVPAPTSSREEPISTRILHAGLIVGDLDASRRFYEAFGFRETWRGSRSGTELSWTNMKVRDGDDYLEFMLYGTKPAPDARGTQHHICLEVPDVEAARIRLLDRAGKAGYSRALETRVGTNRRRQLNLYDPDGTRVELMEPDTVDGKPVPSSTAPPPRPASSTR